MSSRVVRFAVAVLVGTIGVGLGATVGCAGGVTSPGLVPDSTKQNQSEPGDVSYVLPVQMGEGMVA